MNHSVRSQDVRSALVSRIEALGLFHLRFTLRTVDALALPDVAGPTLRGAFGRALLDQLCPFAEPRCNACEWVADCAFGSVFQSPTRATGDEPHDGAFAQPPHPLWLRWESPPRPGNRPGDLVRIDVLGTHAARRFLPDVARALGVVAGKGLGRDRGRLDVVAIDDVADDRTIPVPALPALNSVRVWRPSAGHLSNSVLLRTETPLRIFRNGRLVPEPDAADVVAAAWRRISILAPDAEVPAEADRALRDELLSAARDGSGASRGELRMVRRRSGRTGLRQSFLGFEGEIEFVRPSAALQDLLEAGRRTGIGKGIAFGFGSYSLVPLP